VSWRRWIPRSMNGSRRNIPAQYTIRGELRALEVARPWSPPMTFADSPSFLADLELEATLNGHFFFSAGFLRD